MVEAALALLRDDLDGLAAIKAAIEEGEASGSRSHSTLTISSSASVVVPLPNEAMIVSPGRKDIDAVFDYTEERWGWIKPSPTLSA